MNEIFKRVSIRKYEDKPVESRPQQDRYDETRVHCI